MKINSWLPLQYELDEQQKVAQQEKLLMGTQTTGMPCFNIVKVIVIAAFELQCKACMVLSLKQLVKEL